MKRLLFFIIAAAFLAGTVNAAVNTVNADDPEFWQDHSLVYAIVKDVSNVGHGEYRVTIRPVATLTGRFDCGLSPKVVLTLVIGEASAISAPPESGSKTLILIREKETTGDDGKKQRKYRVPSSVVTFMPGKKAVAEVSSIEDRVVTEVMDNVVRTRTGTGKK